jgi:hypothetical protein
MNNLRILLLIITILSFSSCAKTDIANNIRVLVKGKVVNQNNEPIKNASVEVFTDANATGANRVLLGQGFSDDLGVFEITSLFGSNDLFYVEVSYANDFSRYRYQTNTSEFAPEDLTFALQIVTLKNLSTFNYNIRRESAEGTTLDFSFRYTDPQCSQIFDDGILNESTSYCFPERTFNRQLSDNIPNAENRQFIVPLSDTVMFTYSINNGSQITEVIIVNTANYEFEFSY